MEIHKWFLSNSQNYSGIVAATGIGCRRVAEVERDIVADELRQHGPSGQVGHNLDVPIQRGRELQVENESVCFKPQRVGEVGLELGLHSTSCPIAPRRGSIGLSLMY